MIYPFKKGSSFHFISISLVPLFPRCLWCHRSWSDWCGAAPAGSFHSTRSSDGWPSLPHLRYWPGHQKVCRRLGRALGNFCLQYLISGWRGPSTFWSCRWLFSQSCLMSRLRQGLSLGGTRPRWWELCKIFHGQRSSSMRIKRCRIQSQGSCRRLRLQTFSSWGPTLRTVWRA